jgi:Ca2+-binding RTX toxin-like protein
MRIRILATLLVLAGLGAGVADAKTSHAGWPEIDGVLAINRLDQSRDLHGLPGRHNELLGGHGSDRIYGQDAGDVLWGDYKPCCQPTTQVDRMHGRGGRDFIYASHGKNYIWAGAGNDVIHGHFGHGEIHCGSGRDIVFLSHRSRPHWHLYGCERISYFTRGY